VFGRIAEKSGSGLAAALGSIMFTKTKYFIEMITVVLITIIPNPTFSVDWDSCAQNLDRLRRASRDAVDAANDVKSKAEEYENCKRYPNIHDLMRDRCQSKAWSYENALRTLESALVTVDSRIRSVSSSCGYDLTSIGSAPYSQPNPPSSTNRLCDLFRSYKDRLSPDTLFNICTQSMPESDCRKCLGEK
jgi:hypothetical protein